jgi:mRNA interferase RelE/StbE
LLETEARPPQSKPLKGRPDLWAFRAGTYRLLYRIDDNALEVLVVRIAHRREVYRRL